MSHNEPGPPEPEENFDRPQGPPSEAWWERELLRNQKLMDKYQAVWEEEGSTKKYRTPEDLYNKVHFGIDPPERPELHDLDRSLDENEEDEDAEGEEELDSESDSDDSDADLEWEHDFDISDSDLEDAKEATEDDAGFEQLEETAMEFAVRGLKLSDLPPEAEDLRITCAKIGAHLVGGHAMGYDDQFLCANIVKCRWALADSEFCRDTLAHLVARTGNTEFAEMLEQCRSLHAAITDRITRLRGRVWW